MMPGETEASSGDACDNPILRSLTAKPAVPSRLFLAGLPTRVPSGMRIRELERGHVVPQRVSPPRL